MKGDASQAESILHGKPGLAIDGDAAADNTDQRACAQTGKWWQVDLKRIHTVRKIYVTTEMHVAIGM